MFGMQDGGNEDVSYLMVKLQFTGKQNPEAGQRGFTED